MKVALIATALVLLFLVSPVAFLCYEAGAADDESRKRDQEWLQFSMQHHCRVVREDSFANPGTLWQCDGNFQVKRF